MTRQEEILDWLVRAILGNAQDNGERFYFDVLDKQFFCLPSKDYIFGQLKTWSQNLSKGPFYPWTETDVLHDRLARIDNKDTTIIQVPVLTEEDNKALDRLYASTYEGGESFWLKQKRGYLIYKAMTFITGFNIDLDKTSTYNYDGAALL